MGKLEFIRTVQANKHELVIPDRDDLFLKPEDWPRQLAPGILNVEVSGRADLLTLVSLLSGTTERSGGRFRVARNVNDGCKPGLLSRHPASAAKLCEKRGKNAAFG